MTRSINSGQHTLYSSVSCTSFKEWSAIHCAGQSVNVSRCSSWFIKKLSSFSACKILGTTTADRKLELGHIAPVHSTPCVRYPYRLLAQNTIYLVIKSLLNTKLHLPAWQQLTDCGTSVNLDQTFWFWSFCPMPCAYRALAAAHIWLGQMHSSQQQHQHGANFAGCRRE